jgi:hypothetical protein
MSDFMATVKRAAARRSIHDSAYPFNSTTDEDKAKGFFREPGRPHLLMNSFALLKSFSYPCSFVSIRG